MTARFYKKTIIITGASAGVGAACARAFAAQKANLVLVARGQQGLDLIKEELSTQTNVLTVAMDVSDTDQCLALFAKAELAFGSIDVLVNNAGMHSRGNLENVSPADVGAMVDINIRAPLMLSCASIPYLQRAGGGGIVMVGSLAGMAPLQGAATYSGTKAGLRAFAYALADEMRGTDIHVGVVSPGPIDTGFIMDEIDSVEDIVFSQPMSTADEVADAVLRIAAGDRLEIPMPAASGRMVNLGYLFPWLRRYLRPKLYAIGRKNKDKYRNRQINE
ncbi:MAG: short-subunit dehydrogenase [Alphaproteobacteria bacterium]|jgi:short-subunit dehydrogenase